MLTAHRPRARGGRETRQHGLVAKFFTGVMQMKSIKIVGQAKKGEDKSKLENFALKHYTDPGVLMRLLGTIACRGVVSMAREGKELVSKLLRQMIF